jgi:hypothetical protein
MKVLIIRADYCRGRLNKLDLEQVDVDGPLWPYARGMASDERAYASSYQREFYSRAMKSGNGAYGWSAGEENAVYLIPEGHPNFDLDYDRYEDWSDEAIETWAENLGDCR